jgi:hypothetical protein
MARQDGRQAASFPEVEVPDPRPADALPQATAAWDASASARPDAAADAAGLRPQPADGAEKWAARVPAVQEQDDSRHQLEPQAAPAAVPAAAEPCTPVVARFAEQSCAVLEAEEPTDVLLWEPMAERSPKSWEALPGMESVPPAALLPRVQAVQ